MNNGKRRVESAKRAIADAQRDVSAAIGEIAAAERADKRHASERLKTALDCLRGAQADLSYLEDWVTD